MTGAGSVGVAVAAAATAGLAAGWFISQQQTEKPKLVLVAVSGTIEDGFELRKNINYPGGANATFIGWALCRGAKMFFDVKDVGSRERDDRVPHRVNPAMVLTGNASDANQYALYLVDERACLVALLGEPRYLSMAPDVLRIDIEDARTSPEVRQLAKAVAKNDGLDPTNLKQCAVMAVITTYKSQRFVPAPPVEVRDDGTQVTWFRGSLAKFANLQDGVAPSSQEWNKAVAEALGKADKELIESKAKGAVANGGHAPGTTDDSIYCSGSQHPLRLSRRWLPSEFNALAAAAEIGARAG